MACIYQSITLQPNEQFVLPPGATLVAATDTAQLSTSNNCLDLNNVESFECYAVMFTKTLENAGQTPAYATIDIYGIRIGEVNYPFTPGFSLQGYLTTGIGGTGNITAITQLRNAIDTTPLGGIITDINIIQYIGTNDNELAWKVIFKTVPSIGGDHTRMSFYGLAGPGNSGIGSFEIEFDVVPYADRQLDDVDDRPYPTCTTT
jgi:hypothetical protein